MPFTKRFTKFLALLVFVCAVGCSEIDLYQDLGEEDANEILVLLSDHGIKADKKKVIRQNETFYAIAVSAEEMSKARSLLLEHHLPRRKELGLTGVYSEKGLIPTPDEQKARYLLALKGEIINSLESLPDIVDADVVLNVPTPDEFASEEAKKRLRPTASVIVRAKPGISTDSVITESKLQQFVANAIEGLNPRDVTVIISYLRDGSRTLRPGDVLTLSPKGTPETSAEEPTEQLLGLSLDAASKDRLKMYLLLFFLILILLSTGLIVSIVQGSRMRRTLATLQGAPGGPPAIEGRVVDEQRRLGGGGEGTQL
ncbi:MAG: hypothetical protein HY465_03875 [Deltaproteobacteria bacterium]|nr:hypothetical protein [Deltaproteobacteria bacterium]